MKKCLITGASRGFGESLARRFKDSGYFVMGLAREIAALQRLQEQGILDTGYCCDLADPAVLDAFLTDFENQHGQLDLLVHNAGIQNSYSIEDANYYDLVRRETAVNFLAPIRLTTALLPLLLKQPSQIVVVTSLLQYAPKTTGPGYCSSKAALASWTSNLRSQLSGRGVRVTEFIPGLIKTTMSEKASEVGVEPDRLAEQLLRELTQETVLGEGAKLGYFLHRIWPGLFRRLMVRG